MNLHLGKVGKLQMFQRVAHNEECGAVKWRGGKVWSKQSLSAVATANM